MKNDHGLPALERDCPERIVAVYSALLRQLPAALERRGRCQDATGVRHLLMEVARLQAKVAAYEELTADARIDETAERTPRCEHCHGADLRCVACGGRGYGAA